MSKIILMVNEKCGPEVIKHVLASGDEIVRLYISKHGRNNEDSIRESKLSESQIYFAKSLKDPEHIESLKKVNFEYIITVQWPFLLREEVFGLASKGTVNFHPALLPYGRGWYPHVHNIIRGTPAGVTLHLIDSGADTGPIWTQKIVHVKQSDQAKDVYLNLQQAMIDLFIESWDDIKTGKLVPKAQRCEDAVYFEKSDIVPFDQINLNASMRVGEVLNLLRARSFGDRGFAFFVENGKKVFINVKFIPE